MKKFLKSFKHAIRGIAFVSKEERNFQIQLVIATLLIVFMIASDFSPLEISLIIFAIVIVLMSEIINTVIEDLLNKLHPNQDRTVGKIKDMIAGFVLIASLGSLAVGIIVFIAHFL